MSRGLSSAAKAELYAAQTGGVWLVLLTITHDSLTTLRFVNDRQSVTSGGDVYTAAAFSVRLPADRDEAPRAIITLDNVDQTAVAAIRSITTPAAITVEIIRRSDPDTILVTYPDLRLAAAKITATAIELELSADPVLEESYPGTDFTPLLFPAGFDR